MNIIEAIKILERHNKWRRGANTESVDPTVLGDAIDVLINFTRNVIDYKKKKINTVNDLINHLKMVSDKDKPIIVDYVKSDIDEGFSIDEIESYDDCVYIWVSKNEKQ